MLCNHGSAVGESRSRYRVPDRYRFPDHMPVEGNIPEFDLQQCAGRKARGSRPVGRMRRVAITRFDIFFIKMKTVPQNWRIMVFWRGWTLWML